jgi:galactose-1-phosphate uridylyltransferase
MKVVYADDMEDMMCMADQNMANFMGYSDQERVVIALTTSTLHFDCAWDLWEGFNVIKG